MDTQPLESDPEEKVHSEFMRAMRRRALVIGLIALTSVGAIFALYRKQFPGVFDTTQATWGQFGDYFGGTLNPLLAFLSFGALLYTIVLQIDELNLTRRELKKSAAALTIQAQHIQRQNFEATLFQLIRLHHEIIGTAFYNRNITGRDAMNQFAQALREGMKQLSGPHTLDSVCRFYDEDFHRRFGRHLMHFFRNTAVMLDHVGGAPADVGKYAAIVRAQLSLDDQILLFYEGAIKRRGQLRRLLVRHGTLYGLDTKELRFGNLLRPEYGESAFERPSSQQDDE